MVQAVGHRHATVGAYRTPYFLFSKSLARENLEALRSCLPAYSKIFYAMKSNSELPLLEVLARGKCGFEVSSSYELKLLAKVGVLPERILAGNAVMSRLEIRKFYHYGVKLYAADSTGQIDRVAAEVPAGRIYLRVLTDDQANSVFTMSEKFGVVPERALALALYAQAKGLAVRGLSFNVGSQARNPQAWGISIRQLSSLVHGLQCNGVAISFMNIGGGFPWQYHAKQASPTLQSIGEHIRQAVDELSQDIEIYLEPGRALSARPFTLITSVIAKTFRPNGTWLQLDAGAYNALLETMSCQGSIRYRISWPKSYASRQLQEYIVTGPTCDSLDVIDHKALLPADIKEGDRLIIHDAGAYSFALATTFNGFPVPKVRVVD